MIRRGRFSTTPNRRVYFLLPRLSQMLILRNTIFLRPVCGRRIIAHIAGLSVSATTAEMSTDTTIVTENCRNSEPVMPARKLTGIKTAASTSDVAISAPVSSFIAMCVASRAPILRCSMMRSTFSTTTIASSTTIPMARTSPSSVSMLSEKPMISIKPKVPTSEIGTATIGINAVRQLCNERKTTRITRNSASNNVLYTSWIDSAIYSVISNGTR